MKKRPGYLAIAEISAAVLRHLHRAAVAVRVEAPRRRADVVVAVVGSRDGLDEHVEGAQPLLVGAVGAGRELVELLRRALAARRLVAVRGAGDPGEPGPNGDLRERGGLRGAAVDDAAPERLVVAARVEVRDVVGGADDGDPDRHAEDARSLLEHLDPDALARRRGVRVDGGRDSLHVGRELRGLLRRGRRPD